MQEVAAQIATAADAVRQRWDNTPRVGIMLGSGLAGLANQIAVEQSFEYAEIPYFPRTTALGHKGRLVCGRLADVPVIAFQGRFHLYEGYTAQQVVLPARLTRALGASTLIVSNAVGGVNPHYAVGDMMVIDDQINFLFDNPLIGVNDETLGPRFPDMSSPYDAKLMEIAVNIARRQNFVLHKGVYLAMLGPTFETRAEYRMARHLGADVVGMSTVPEVIAARHAEMRVLGLSTITNLGSPDDLVGTSGHDVIAAAKQATDKLTKIVHGVVASLT